MTIALCLTGCATKAKTAEPTAEALATATMDSLVTETRRTQPLTIPMDSVTLTIPADSLLTLPPRSSYKARSGRASVEVGLGGGGRIEVYAQCDSLQLLAEQYERTANYWHGCYTALAATQSSSSKADEQDYNPIITALAGLLCGLALGIAVTLFLTNKNK